MEDSRPLSVAEIRWCMIQEVWLQTIQSRLATRSAVDHYNDLAGDFNRHCTGRRYGSNHGQARRDVESTRESIIGAALEDIQRLNGGEVFTRQTQDLLAFLGYNPGVSDGVYGARTKAAIEEFQREGGVLVDGLLGEELLEKLQVAYVRRLIGREKIPSIDLVVIVKDDTGGPVFGAEVVITVDRDFYDDERTNERGRAEFAAVPSGKLNLNVRQNQSRSRFTIQIADDPHQEVHVVLPTR